MNPVRRTGQGQSSWLDLLPRGDPNMSKKTVFTNITPLPATVIRDTAVGLLHNHSEMIELNPLVIRHGRSTAPPNATPEEVESMIWYELTDEIQYVPGTPAKGEVTYKGGFYDLPRGLQTHVFAPAGVDIRAHWTVGGTMPGEEKEPIELGLNVPRDRLYIREDVDLRCNVFLTNFVKRNMKKSHGVLVQRLVEKANLVEERRSQLSARESVRSSSTDGIREDRGPVFSPAPSTSTHQSSYTSPNPRSDFFGTPSPRCSCESGIHAKTCPWYPISASRQPPPHLASSYQPQPKIKAPASSSSTNCSTGSYSCHCTGGVHDMSCKFYPGLRLPQQTRQAAPQLSQLSSYQQLPPPSSSSLLPDPLRPKSRGTGVMKPQRFGEHAELPGAIEFPADQSEHEWPDLDSKPESPMTTRGGLMTVAVELDSNPVAAQRYYEYQGERTEQLW